MDAIYNEIEAYPAQWIRNLIAAGHIAPGRVDERSIRDLTPADVAGPGQRHFFAGIGAWSHALRLAGWPDDVSVWTGSCPCQPFSSAGRRAGFDDERHLWPAWFDLVRECRPAVIFGEQVGSALEWLDLVFDDLEGAGYTCWSVNIPAASVGAPHIRQCLYWVAYAQHGDAWERLVSEWHHANASGVARVMGDASSSRSGRDPRADACEQASRAGERNVDRRIGDITGVASALRRVADAGQVLGGERPKIESRRDDARGWDEDPTDRRSTRWRSWRHGRRLERAMETKAGSVMWRPGRTCPRQQGWSRILG